MNRSKRHGRLLAEHRFLGSPVPLARLHDECPRLVERLPSGADVGVQPVLGEVLLCRPVRSRPRLQPQIVQVGGRAAQLERHEMVELVRDRFVTPAAAARRFLIGSVYETGGRTDDAQPERQTVERIVACVAAGFTAPGTGTTGAPSGAVVAGSGTVGPAVSAVFGCPLVALLEPADDPHPASTSTAATTIRRSTTPFCARGATRFDARSGRPCCGRGRPLRAAEPGPASLAT
jgi:hypothetical protein